VWRCLSPSEPRGCLHHLRPTASLLLHLRHKDADQRGQPSLPMTPRTDVAHVEETKHSISFCVSSSRPDVGCTSEWCQFTMCSPGLAAEAQAENIERKRPLPCPKLNATKDGRPHTAPYLCPQWLRTRQRMREQGATPIEAAKVLG
jgi:hypothetical protein